MKQIVDRKRAASGERGEDEGMVLAPVQSLVAALRTPNPEQHSSTPTKSLVEAPEPFVERRGVGPKPGRPKTMPHHLRKLMNDLPARMSAMSHIHVNDNREIVATVGPAERGDGRQMNLDEIHMWDLLKEPMLVEDTERVIEKLHPFIYKLEINRKELTSNSVVFELGLYSRVIGQEHKDYLGKTKVFFPRPSDELTVWVNLAKIG